MFLAGTFPHNMLLVRRQRMQIFRRFEMKFVTLLLALASASLLGGGAAAAADNARKAEPASEAVAAVDASARKKVRRSRSYRHSYGYDRPFVRRYDRPYVRAYPRQGYYRGVRPGWGYGPDPGDYAWPPFHFRPYW
jgi:hypothetical protein